ncbi:hypothetical protein BGX27_000326, partial [Mortierella sp. AM989]
SYRAAIELPTLSELKTHLEVLDGKDFQPKTYTRRRRLPDDRLPPRLTSTVHGIGDFLTEIRNVVGTKEDVK